NMLPSCSCAPGCPCSAWYCKALSAFLSESRAFMRPQRTVSAMEGGVTPRWTSMAKPDGGGTAARGSTLMTGAGGTGRGASRLSTGIGPAAPPRAVSKASAGAPPRATMAIMPMAASDIRITLLFGEPARVCHGAAERGADLLGVFPDVAGGELALAWFPIRFPTGEFLVGELDVEG